MTDSADLDAKYRALRQQLQVQRQLLLSRLNPARSPAADTAFPRSMTMRMLTGKSTMLMLILAEVLPLLVARYTARSSSRARDS